MKTLNRKLIATAVALTLTATGAVAFAKGGYNNQVDQGSRLQYIFTQLEITEAQQADVLAVMETLQEEHRQVMWDQMQALRDQEDRPTREQMQTLMDAQRTAQSQALSDQLNTVLSPEVTAELVEYLDAHRGLGGMRGDRGGKHGNGGMFGNAGPGARNN